MGTFAETASIYYRISLPTKKNKLLFSVYINIETASYMYISIYIYMLPFQMETEMEVCRFDSFVALFTKKQMEVIRLQRTKWTCPPMIISFLACSKKITQPQLSQHRVSMSLNILANSNSYSKPMMEKNKGLNYHISITSGLTVCFLPQGAAFWAPGMQSHFETGITC
jgi:hypothetical protein